MRVLVDQSRCAGHALCYSQAPEVFELDDDGYIAVDGEVPVPAGQEGAARKGVAACPERVLSVLD